jgi:hypothetical protein
MRPVQIEKRNADLGPSDPMEFHDARMKVPIIFLKDTALTSLSQGWITKVLFFRNLFLAKWVTLAANRFSDSTCSQPTERNAPKRKLLGKLGGQFQGHSSTPSLSF